MRAASAGLQHIEVNPLKVHAIELLANGARLSKSWIEIADEVGIHRDTLLNWRKDEKFREAVLERTRENIRDAVPNAFTAIMDSLKSDDEKIKLRSAELILKVAGELIDRVDATYREDAKGMLDALDSELEKIKDSPSPKVPNLT